MNKTLEKPCDYSVPVKPGQLKKMTVSPADFFLAALATFGPPSQEPFEYTYTAAVNFRLQGVGPWCHYHPDGIRWTALVMMHGEAKSRAHRWYIKYAQWWRDQKRIPDENP